MSSLPAAGGNRSPRLEGLRVGIQWRHPHDSRKSPNLELSLSMDKKERKVSKEGRNKEEGKPALGTGRTRRRSKASRAVGVPTAKPRPVFSPEGDAAPCPNWFRDRLQAAGVRSWRFPWPLALRGALLQPGPLTPCRGCRSGTWVTYGGVPTCLACALWHEAASFTTAEAGSPA
jgi:hypothetical protein